MFFKQLPHLQAPNFLAWRNSRMRPTRTFYMRSIGFDLSRFMWLLAILCPWSLREWRVVRVKVEIERREKEFYPSLRAPLLPKTLYSESLIHRVAYPQPCNIKGPSGGYNLDTVELRPVYQKVGNIHFYPPIRLSYAPYLSTLSFRIFIFFKDAGAVVGRMEQSNWNAKTVIVRGSDWVSPLFDHCHGKETLGMVTYRNISIGTREEAHTTVLVNSGERTKNW